MTEIVNGELRYNELTQNANGGTELMARRIARDVPKELLEGVQIIHSRVRDLEPDMKRILVCHDLAQDPEVANLADPEYRKQFDKIVFVSNWQQHMFNLISGVPFKESLVIPNGIETEQFSNKNTDGPIRLIYHTTPHRGLQLLLPAFEEASKHFDLHLDVFSSFKAYGWEERDEPFKVLFDRIDELPNATNHGFQSNEVIREHLKRSHVFAYPSIWGETSCLALIEAMSFGNFCIHSNLGALAETAGGLTDCYMYNEDLQTHLNEFYKHLFITLQWIANNREGVNPYLEGVSITANHRYNWETRILPKWVELLQEIKK